MPNCNAYFEPSAESENWQNSRAATHQSRLVRLLLDNLPELDWQLGLRTPLGCGQMNN